ncbi:M14 family zinc carboxypeptidase [Isoptericola dokdonensis]|uniref:Zinc carboxypeptidase n=1 Tax=Isoptericola dokdonensis DS-3 TaxID=1300344 RepID=A0A161I233_9MICO|nr:M14 family zinc carboxypeptidase [Isoptericola dokdonensis]ANC31505.1 Zinc carboxypeptidase [Isoptericola dokdonensis DS-3]
MRLHRTVAGLSGIAVATSCVVGLAPTATATPSPGTSGPDRAEAAGASARSSFADLVAAAKKSLPERATDGAIDMPSSYPSQPALKVFDPVADDATTRNGTIAYSDIAPRLTELMASSDRVSTQVVGQSTQGRDLYLVTITAPESRSQTTQQTRWREKIRTSPAAAAKDRALAKGYKTPVWFSSNIHGNEWEGTDAAMRLLEELATSDDPATLDLLREHRVYLSLTLNPDGRTAATRATTLSLDANRDMVTGTTPEARSFVATTQALQPLYAADFHGYTGVLQVEPCGPPHGDNYEYDLFIPHGYALARQVEDDVVAADIPGNTYYDTATGDVVEENTGNILIPYRDTPSGWDDYPPIFTAQYAAFHGAVTSTVELPHGRDRGLGTTTPQDAAINTEVAHATMVSMLDYVAAHSDEMLADQIEVFRRGVAGAPKQQLTEAGVAAVPGPDEWKALWDVSDDQEPVDLPRAYVIPVGAGQRSSSDAEALVDQLLFHGVEVQRLWTPTTIDGVRYPVGSFVVDMHQPRRGLANVLLATGSDISAKLPSMYDISAWSLGDLWGATVDAVGSTTDRELRLTVPLQLVPQDGYLPWGAKHVAFDLAGVEDFRALNALLEEDAPVWLLDDGRAAVGPAGIPAARDAVADFDIRFEALSGKEVKALGDATELEDLTVAYVGAQDDLLSLTELGFDDLVRVTASGVDAGAATGTTGLEDADVLWVGSSFNPGATGDAAVEAWLADGGAIVGRTAAAFDAAAAYGLVEGQAVTGNRSGNGIVAVDTPDASMFADHPQDESFIYPAVWFTGLGEGTTVELSYADDPLLAGHWNASSGAGPDQAAGQAAVVSGESADGARAVVFGTTPFFRTHPKGGLSQAATAIFWATSD